MDTTNEVSIAAPEPMNSAALEGLTLVELAAIRERLVVERSVVKDRTGADVTAWEVELAYVDRAIERRRDYEARTPKKFWS